MIHIPVYVDVGEL